MIGRETRREKERTKGVENIEEEEEEGVAILVGLGWHAQEEGMEMENAF